MDMLHVRTYKGDYSLQKLDLVIIWKLSDAFQNLIVVSYLFTNKLTVPEGSFAFFSD